jgi:hypothetical protein
MFEISLLVAIARNSGIYINFIFLRKQQTKLGLQTDIENAAEPICCPVLKTADKCFEVYIVL